MGDKVLESTLHKWLDEQLSLHGDEIFFMWVENASCAGTPDLYISGECGELWVELKTANSGKTIGHALTGFEIRPIQKEWHFRYGKIPGKQSVFLFQVGRGAKARRYMVGAAHLLRAERITERFLMDHCEAKLGGLLR
jgi:hypothetical protein